MIVALWCGVLGLAIGSFLNVVIWRVPRGESVVSPASRCPKCDVELRFYDNVPVVSWLVLRGRCRSCRSRISIRYPLVEATTGVLFAAIGAKVGLYAGLPAYLYLGAIAIALAMIDLDVRRLPNAIVLPSYGVALVLLGITAAVDSNPHAFVRALLGMTAYYGVFFLMAFIYPAGMGFGDVKLAGVLGLYLGYLGWDVLAVGAFGGVLLGGIVGSVLMAAGRAGRKSAIPYGPFMLTAGIAAIFVGSELAHAYAHLALTT